MIEKILNFVKYNNAFTIVVMMLFLGAGVSFAANPELRDSVYASQETVVSIDNTMVVSTDLDNFNFNLKIDSVTDDAKNYYAVYSYQTLTIEDGVWKNKQIDKTLTVSKEALDGRDLGLHLARELGENINYELSYLKRVQKLEQEKGRSQKVVTTEYSGLIGKLLDPKEQVIEGYEPVIPEPVEVVVATPESNPASVILSTPYTEPPVVTPPPSVPTSEVVVDTATTTPTIVSEPTQVTLPPAPEDMVDETLVHEVVEQLLQNETTDAPEVVEEVLPVPEPTTPSPEPILTPEIVPDPVQ